MSKPAEHDATAPTASFLTRLYDWWRYHDELGSLPRDELEHMALRLRTNGTKFTPDDSFVQFLRERDDIRYGIELV